MTTVALAEIADLQVGFAFKSRDFRDEAGSGTRLLRGDNIGQGSLRWDGAKYWSENGVEDRYVLKAGDLVLAMDRPWVGAGLKFATLRESDLPAYLVQRVARLRARRGTDQRYLHYVVANSAFTDHILGVQTGTAVPHVSGGQILSYQLVPHRYAEQRAIAEVLGALDDKIAANAALVAIADQLAAALLRTNLSKLRAPLVDIASITMGSSPPGDSYNEVGEGVVFYQGVRDFGVRVPTNRVWTTEPVRMARARDTLLSVRAPVGRTNLASEETCIGRGLAAIRSSDARPMTLFHVLRNDPGVWAPYESEGTVFGSINKKQLMGLSVSVVEPDQQTSLEARLAAIEGRISSALGESDRLSATRDALLPALMSGKIRVKDAERAVEEVV